jgi:hypothetical protein
MFFVSREYEPAVCSKEAIIFTLSKGKGAFHTRTVHEGPDGKYSFLTSELDASGWLTPRPGRFISGKDPVPML